MARKREMKQSVLESLTVGDVENDAIYSVHPVNQIPLFSHSERFMVLPWVDMLESLKGEKALTLPCEPDEYESLTQAFPGVIEAAEERAMFRYDGRARPLWVWLWNGSPFHGVPFEKNEGEIACDFCRAAL